ncbi:MAG: hypothetical protein JRH08_05740 [Deltaproteobacteria bacterium]|nr:hypothetical protein [Deltaproteobacteria bacterium]MBW1927536.1 hypothetical protein [Deltaproteobacteria bacterium]MBW2026536.1 hypothetical protein [Deltaproteobacteria bacterium]MBW2125197.1 hypothetical protein [Deltaproteobacteria bacterium]RLB11864.1 MAG: hypothetical protein DRG63_12515 [Deltaproteobacteria bacterium]
MKQKHESREDVLTSGLMRKRTEREKSSDRGDSGAGIMKSGALQAFSTADRGIEMDLFSKGGVSCLKDWFLYS